MPTAYVLLNSDLGSDETIITKVKGILDNEENITYEVQGVYGVYDFSCSSITIIVRVD